MIGRCVRLACVGVGLALAASRLDAGGWAVVTLKDVPDVVVAATPVTWTYSVRGHGVQLIGGLTGWIEARRGEVVVKAPASAASETGYYVATMTLPVAGEWTVTVMSGFPGAQSGPIALRATDRGTPAPRVTDAERGKRLFAAKGCVTCHAHAAVSQGPRPAPELTGRVYAPAFLTMFLADPSIKPPTVSNGLRMPDLGLSDAEIWSLVSFLTAASQPTTPVTTARR
jgi:mono/diheme cytochrome c family protein